MIESIWQAKHGKKPKGGVLEPALARIESKLVEPVNDGTTETWREGAAKKAGPPKGETRQQKWKRLHPEKVRAAQAKLMAKRRAKEKAEK